MEGTRNLLVIGEKRTLRTHSRSWETSIKRVQQWTFVNTVMNTAVL
jgi:hypothetical protein